MEIVTGTAQVPAEAGAMPCFVVRPAQSGPHPGVVVVMEAFGLNRHIQDVCQRLAREGYVALAPNLYYRENGVAVGYDELPAALRLMQTLWDQKVLDDMAAAISYLQSQDFVRADRIGMTGFCMGGRITFLTACRNPAVKAAAPFYGGSIGSVTPSERTPKAPLDHAEGLSCPMLVFYGEADPFIPPEEVERVRSTLERLGKRAEVIVYPGAGHGFLCDERDSFHPQAAGDAWDRLLRFFDAHLKA